MIITIGNINNFNNLMIDINYDVLMMWDVKEVLFCQFDTILQTTYKNQARLFANNIDEKYPKSKTDEL